MSVVLGCRTWCGLNIFAGLLIVRVPRTDSFMARCLILWQQVLLCIRFPPLWAPHCCWQIVKQLLLSQLAPTRRDKQRQIKKRQSACLAKYSHCLSLSEYHYKDWKLWLSDSQRESRSTSSRAILVSPHLNQRSNIGVNLVINTRWIC